MKKFVLIFLAAVAGGIIGGAVVWLAVEPVAPIVIGSRRENVGAPTPAAPIATAERNVRSSTVAQATNIVTANVTMTGPVHVRPDSADRPERVSSSSTDRIIQQGPAVSENQVVVSHAVVTMPGNPVPAPPPSAPAIVSSGAIDDALSYALQAADPYVKQGFTVREDYWGGELPAKGTKAIVQQLFKGNEYWFWMGTAMKEAKVSVHLYDADGNLAEAEDWQKPHFAAARIIPKKTASYYLIVAVESRAPAVSSQPPERVLWGLCYGFR